MLRRSSLLLWLIAAGTGFAVSHSCYADVSTDGSLTGSVRSIGPGASVDYLITEDFGRRSGGNVFFSFGEFSVLNGEVAAFATSPLATDNLIARITSDAPGNLSGRLNSFDPGANLWLISPSGWTFGSAAQIDVGGAVHFAVADSLLFDDGAAFDISTATSVLPATMPRAFELSPEGALIGEGLSVFRSTGALGLFAEEVRVAGLRAGSPSQSSETRIQIVANNDGSTVFSQLISPVESGSQPVTAAADVDGNLQLDSSRLFLEGNGGDRLLLSASENLQLSNSQIEVTGTGTNLGRVLIRGGNVLVDSETEFVSAVPSRSQGTQGVALEITAQDALNFEGSLIATARAIDSASGAVALSGATTTLDGARFTFSRAAPGQSGAVTFEGGERLDIINTQIENVTVFGDGEPIQFSAPIVTLDASFLQADTQDTLNGTGIEVVADQIGISNGSTITADVERGVGAGIVLQASERIDISDSLVTTESFDDADGATLRVEAPSINLSSGGRLTSDVVLSGSGGTIEVVGQDVRILGANVDSSSSTGIFARSGSFSLDPSRLAEFLQDPNFATGDGGNVLIEAQTLELENAQISVDTFGRGNAGSIDIRIRQSARLDSNALISSSATGVFDSIGADQLGGGGDVNFSSGSLLLTNGGRITSDTQSDIAPGGEITINVGLLGLEGSADIALQSIEELDGGILPTSQFTGVASNSSGNATGGSITLVGDILRSRAGILSASASGAGGGGDLSIGTAQLDFGQTILDSSSGLLARAQQGNGGSISIFSEQFVQDTVAVVSADSAGGNAGTVDVVAPELNISGSIVDIDVPVLDATQLLQDLCASGGDSELSTLKVAGERLSVILPTGYLRSESEGRGLANLASGCVAGSTE